MSIIGAINVRKHGNHREHVGIVAPKRAITSAKRPVSNVNDADRIRKHNYVLTVMIATKRAECKNCDASATLVPFGRDAEGRLYALRQDSPKIRWMKVSNEWYCYKCRNQI